LRLIREKLENIAEKYRARIRRPVDIDAYFDIDNVLVDVDITVNVEVNITIVKPIPITVAEYEEELEEFNELLAEVQVMLEGAPENTSGRHAAERLVEVAITLKDRAVSAYNEDKVRRALGLIHAAKMHLYNAKMILEHASEWEPEFREEWAHWRQDWAEVKQTFINEGTWANVLMNYEQYAENIRQRWEERLHGGR
jgi:predicted transposase YbfD/YdcC